MTDELRRLFERQARWQKGRRALSWAEKIRQVESIRESIQQLRGAPTGAKDSKPATPP